MGAFICLMWVPSNGAPYLCKGVLEAVGNDTKRYAQKQLGHHKKAVRRFFATNSWDNKQECTGSTSRYGPRSFQGRAGGTEGGRPHPTQASLLVWRRPRAHLRVRCIDIHSPLQQQLHHCQFVGPCRPVERRAGFAFGLQVCVMLHGQG